MSTAQKMIQAVLEM